MQHVTTIDGSRHVALGEVDPAARGDLEPDEAERRLDDLSRELRELQELLFAAESHAVLVILQGMDASGKDVTIQNVFATATAEAIRVAHFTAMTEDEAKHHFLWRAHRVTPERGEVAIFDRSYYEQIIEPQVEQEVDAETLDRHHEDVTAFEAMLAHADTVVVKFFLHVSNDEQARRLRERMANRETAWKISPRDWTSRRNWDRYMAAYERTMNATATRDAPWHVVPADHEWFHNVALAEKLVERLRPYRDGWIAERDRKGREEREAVRREAPEAFAEDGG